MFNFWAGTFELDEPKRFFQCVHCGRESKIIYDRAKLTQLMGRHSVVFKAECIHCGKLTIVVTKKTGVPVYWLTEQTDYD